MMTITLPETERQIKTHNAERLLRILNEDTPSRCTDPNTGFTPISGLLGGVLKEICCRSELRQRLEAERDRPLEDSEFLEIAERTGLWI